MGTTAKEEKKEERKKEEKKKGGGGKAGGGGGGGGKREKKSRGPHAGAGLPVAPPRLRQFYNETVRVKLQQQFGFKNPHEIPVLEKIVVNVGLGEAIKQPRLLDGFAETDVDHDLLEHRNLMRVLEAELLLQLHADGLVVELAQARRRDREAGASVRSTRLLLALAPPATAATGLSAATLLFFFLLSFFLLLFFGCRSHSDLPQRVRGIASPLLTLMRSLVPSSSMRMRIRVGAPDLGSMSITFDA